MVVATQPADQQLADSMALLASLEQSQLPSLRWWCVNPPALLLGTGQRLEEIDLAACAEAGIAVHKRGSGGGAVLANDTLLNLDIAIPHSHALFLEDVTLSYRWLGEVWVVTLDKLGIQAQTVAVTDARADAQSLDLLIKRVCFGARSPYEVTVAGRKLVGFAQRRRRAGSLFQVGVYLHWSSARIVNLMLASASDKAHLRARLDARVVGLDELCQPAPSVTDITAAFAAALSEQTGL